ncbi:DUF6049 family protein [Ornithinimicrobium faecis]|uniref:DUF6049 family protein n=1 Tax=Ornithinimicrobium faecis TaxID=2934158 RepID=A0ABY4YTL5_9MICO|nr:DUF6049 family protein [Ornithinimicrobium sp. HY1793]USQ80078.1 DUF6049 family protein [Ornithinimicrobium sp. HY1793]
MSLHRTARRTRGLLVLLMAYAVLAAAVVAAPLTWGASSASAADDDLLHVQLEQVSPAIVGPGTEVRLEGTLQNLGATPAPVHAVRVSTAYRGLDTRGAVQDWAEEGLLETPIALGEDHIGVAIAPGSTVHWFVDIPADELEPGFEFATLPLRVEVLATGPAPDTDNEDTGESTDESPGTEDTDSEGTDSETTVVPGAQVRTFLPWTDAEDPEFNPVQIAWLAPITLPGNPDLVAVDDARRSDAWLNAIGPDSRTLELLDGLADTSATFVVDPGVIEPLDPVASLTEVVELPGDQEEPSESPEPTDPKPTDPEPTDPEPTDSEPTGSESTDSPEPTGSESAPSAGVQGSVATTGPGGGATQAPGDGEAPTSAPADPPSTPIEGDDPVEPPTPPTIQSAVRDLGNRIEQVPEGRLWWLPVGDTDVGGLLEAEASVDDIAELVGAAPSGGLPAPGRTDLAWPLSEDFSDAMIGSLLQVWSAAGGATGAAGADNGSLGAVVLPNSTLDDTVLTGSAVRTHSAGPQLIGYDERLSGIVAGSGEPEQAGHATQRFLAETLAIYQEGPATDRSLVVAIPRTAAADADQLQALTSAAARAPWLQETTASELLTDAAQAPPATVQQADPPSADAEQADPEQADPDATDPDPIDADPTEDQVTVAALGDLSAYSDPGESPLTPSRLARIDLTRSKVTGVSEIVPGSEAVRRTWMHVLDRQFSASWRAAPQDWEIPVEVAEDLASEITTGLTINPTTINLYADEGLMQITVVNELPIPIEGLQMQVDPGNGRLRVLGQPDPITIGPESRATVQFRAKAVAAGQVPLHTSLSTPNGTQIGSAEETVVRVQPTGVWIYWLLGGVAGVILVLGLWRALRPAGTRRDAEPTDPSTGNVPTSASDVETP